MHTKVENVRAVVWTRLKLIELKKKKMTIIAYGNIDGKKPMCEIK